jgi:lysine 2,3-aminomutase
LFVVDTPGGKRDAHSAEFYDNEYGVSGFLSPAVTSNRMFYYFDPLRTLPRKGRKSWNTPKAREVILSRLADTRVCVTA